MTFGDRLAELRKSNGFTREALAIKLDISKYTLRNYELSINEPNSSFLKQISEMFDVSIDYLMGVTDEKERIMPYQLKSSEYEHIKKYRDLDDHGKDMVDTVLDKEWTRSTSNQEAEPPCLKLMAAHNDSALEDGEVEKMQSDIDMLDRMPEK